MTIKEAILSELGFAPGNVNTVEKAISDQSLTSGDDYVSADHRTGVKWAALNILRILLSTPDTTTSIGGVTTSSMKYDRNAILKRISELEVDLEIVSVKPTITARNVW